MTSISWSPGTEFVRSRLGVSAAATGADEHAPSRIRSEPSMPLGAQRMRGLGSIWQTGGGQYSTSCTLAFARRPSATILEFTRSLIAANALGGS